MHSLVLEPSVNQQMFAVWTPFRVRLSHWKVQVEGQFVVGCVWLIIVRECDRPFCSLQQLS